METLNSKKITVSLVNNDERLSVLPRHFGNCFKMVESAVLFFMDKLCKQYNGGYWNFYELSNGGFYMAPEISGDLALEWDMNQFKGQMSANAAGVVACVFAFNYVCNEYPTIQNRLAYTRLHEYIQHHPEASMIYRAID